MPDIRGRCLCSAVEIALAPPTLFCAHCHCDSCRRAHAAPLVTWTAVQESEFRITKGAHLIVRYESSPGALRCFCQQCGSTVFMFYEMTHTDHGDSASMIYVPVGVLVDPLDREPSGHVSFEEHVSWFEFGDRLPRFRAKTDELAEAAVDADFETPT